MQDDPHPIEWEGLDKEYLIDLKNLGDQIKALNRNHGQTYIIATSPSPQF